jgi:hypothetical protein
MITNIYLLIYFIIILITYYLNKKYINLFFLKLIIITFLTNDLLRIVTTDLNKNLFLFIFKDIILTIFFVISIISFSKRKKVNFLNKNIIFFLIISLFTIIFSYNLSFSSFNIAKLISGSYDLLLYPLFILVIIFLVKKSIDLDKLEKFFFGLNAFLLSILLIQIYDHQLFIQFVLNNYDPYNTEEILRIKSLMFQGKYTTYENKGWDIIVPSIVFSNPGRYGHYILANFLINIFFLIRKKNYTNICSLLIGFMLVIFSSQRASIYLSILVLIFCFINKMSLVNFIKIISMKKKFIFIICFLLIVSVLFIRSFNEKLYYEFTSRIYNTYEPITNSFNIKEKDTASSLNGRLLITLNDLKKIYLEEDINTREILFGRGFGTHSLGMKTIILRFGKDDYVYKKHFFYEQHISTVLYDTGILGFLIYFITFIYLNIIIQKKLKKLIYPKNIEKFILITTIIPLILLNTGYQFSRDYIFQFFYYLLIGLILSYINNLKKVKPLIDY